MLEKKSSKTLKLPPVRNCFTLAMTNKLVVIVNGFKIPKIKKILLYEMKFFVPNYSCLQNPWPRRLLPPDPCSLCPLSSTEFVEPPPTKFLGMPLHCSSKNKQRNVKLSTYTISTITPHTMQEVFLLWTVVSHSHITVFRTYAKLSILQLVYWRNDRRTFISHTLTFHNEDRYNSQYCKTSVLFNGLRLPPWCK